MLEGIIFFLTTILFFVYQPFTGSIQLPAFVGIVLLVLLVFLKSVLIRCAPLFVINILQCKRHEESKQPEPQT